ncbi:MAG: hypothetical protein RMJ37_08180 [Spirochaetia bacterium]|nr:hypothetical protein [Spirochaetota bacterium]MDW8113292.1 hypothetical protein [Spirochaetia bacterium]
MSIFMILYMAIRIENLNSQEADYFLSPRVLTKVFSRLDFLANAASNVPTFLVNKATINKIPAPRVIDENRLRNMMKRKERLDEEELDKLIEDSLRSPENELIVDLIGVYLSGPPNSDSTGEGSSEDSITDSVFKRLTYPCILICPEKIVDISNSPEYGVFRELEVSNGVDLKEVLFSKVYYHELGHGYLRYGSKQRWEGKTFEIVEESYCNAVAFERFRESSELSIVSFFISRQPLEYRGYTVFVYNKSFNWMSVLDPEIFRRLFPKIYRRPFWDLEDVIYYYRRYGIYPFLTYDLIRGFRKVWNDSDSKGFLRDLGREILSEVIMSLAL